jgi:hypothetical protein
MRHFMSYIDDAFLTDFVKLKPTDIESAGDELEIWRDWFRFVREKTDIDLATNLKVEDLAYDVNSSLTKQLIDDYYQGKEHIKINTNRLENCTAKDLVLNSDKPTFIFRNELKNTEITEEKTGFCCINGESFYKKWQHYFKSKAYSISKINTENQLQKWSDLFINYQYPSNAFLIADNYIFSYKPNIPNNLLKLLKELLKLSKNVKGEIDLIIIADEFYKDQNKIEVDIEDLHKQVERYLRDWSFINVNLCIVKAKYHDRLIMSNYFIVNSGNSFNYFNYGATILPQNTRLSITPYTHDYSYVHTYKDELSTIIEESIVFTGTKRNRLLKMLI